MSPMLNKITSTRCTYTLILMCAMICWVNACQSSKLPDSDSYAARLYVKRCGECHQAYNPHSMTASMWAMQVTAMQSRMKQAGVPELTSSEKEAIVDYLKRNAGRQ